MMVDFEMASINPRGVDLTIFYENGILPDSSLYPLKAYLRRYHKKHRRRIMNVFGSADRFVAAELPLLKDQVNRARAM